MAKKEKAKKSIDTIEIDGEILNFASYASYYCRRSLFTSFKIINRSPQAATNVRVQISGSTALILDGETAVDEIPGESSVEVNPQNILNPKYLADLAAPENCSVFVRVTSDKKQVCDLEAPLTALPMDFWGGLGDDAETLSCFVRPKIADCQKIASDAGAQLRNWGMPSEFTGYAGNDKTMVRNAAAAVFGAIRKMNVEYDGQEDLSGPFSAGKIDAIAKNKKASAAEMALFAASCLEGVKLNPVVLFGKKKFAVGVWLYDSCFSSTITDDMSLVQNYVSSGVNNLAIFDCDDLFAHKNANYTTSEGHFGDRLRRGEYEYLLDVRRCRIGGFHPLPLKVKTSSGYELLRETDLSFDEKPQNLVDASRFEYDRAATRDEYWQRRLLDLTQKNNLLNFRYRRDAMKILCADFKGFYSKLEDAEKFTLIPSSDTPADAWFDDGKSTRSLKELLDIEQKEGKLRVQLTPEALSETASSLSRRVRATEEETGCSTLYVAYGFLRWKYDEDREFKYAPISLMGATLSRSKSSGVQLSVSSGCEANTTLIEFLRQEFDIDLRGADGKDLAPDELCAAFRSKIANMKGWLVCEDVYLSQFTFARYAMWADVRGNMPVFSKNNLIASLLSNTNKIENNALSAPAEDDADPCDVYLPLPCDSAQYSAVSESARGTTFVLHGPPGTGKSQTITNMIANAIAHGKRVLFVAEKQAALEVVKKRLDQVGIGAFCLELFSGKSTDKAQVVKNIEDTLALKKDGDVQGFSETGEKIARLRSSLKDPYDALHKKRSLGVSIYEGMLLYLQNQNAPDLLDIETSFYDSLTAKKLSECESMILEAQAAAKECGGIYRSPFSDIGLTKCDAATKALASCSAEVLLAELKHLKNYTGLFLSAFNQKISKFTAKKFENLVEIAKILQGGSLSVFFSCDEAQFHDFFNANVRYDAETALWLRNFKSLPSLSQDMGYVATLEKEMEEWGTNHRSSRVLVPAIKKIAKTCNFKMREDEECEWLRHACEIEKARYRMQSCTNLSRNFTGFGGMNEKKRQDFLAPLYRLHSLCAETFMDYNADAFNGVCIESRSGTLEPMISGFLSASRSFKTAVDRYFDATASKRGFATDEDIFDFYSQKCSALIDNIDMLPAWCSYMAVSKKMNESGLTFMTDAMESGKISGDRILASFRKNVYRNFVRANIMADDVLSIFSGNVLDESAASYAATLDEFNQLTKQKIYDDLVSRLPSEGGEDALAIDLMAFRRRTKNIRGLNLRDLFREAPQLLRATSPCLLMSPITVSQLLPAEEDLFDLVIFDEASQIPTCEAVPALARARSAVIVGDPNQMPPTSFFMGGGSDDDESMETEDLESLLDDCLALGIPQKHLVWHYRSKHESLIAFSNTMYYSSRLCTFPSPDAMTSKVTLRYMENGVYERGGSKCNRQEAQALADEVISRLKDPARRRSSIGVVTFSTPQQLYIERLLSKRIAQEGLEEIAYEAEEPLFIKNLENVQGDERDVILFSVCYGPDAGGRISLNFGPLNQFGGWRRLNVAVSRAREEMIVFSSMRYSHIDMSRTTARGVAGLKAFLEFAEKGRTTISVSSDSEALKKHGIGKFVAEELGNYGYDCRCDVGVSDFRIDVAVADPKDPHTFILAILCDGPGQFSSKDRYVMQMQTLKRNNWSVLRLYTVNFYNNPKREIKKIKDYLDRLTGDGGKAVTSNLKKPYKTAKMERRTLDPAYLLTPEADGDIAKTLKAIVYAEEPISQSFLIKRFCRLCNLAKLSAKAEAKVCAVMDKCAFASCEVAGTTYFAKSEKAFNFDRYRVEDGETMRTQPQDFTPFDAVAATKAVLYTKVSVYLDDLVPLVLKEMGAIRSSDRMCSFVVSSIEEGERRGVFIKSISDKISLA